MAPEKVRSIVRISCFMLRNCVKRFLSEKLCQVATEYPGDFSDECWRDATVRFQTPLYRVFTASRWHTTNVYTLPCCYRTKTCWTVDFSKVFSKILFYFLFSKYFWKLFCKSIFKIAFKTILVSIFKILLKTIFPITVKIPQSLASIKNNIITTEYISVWDCTIVPMRFI